MEKQTHYPSAQEIPAQKQPHPGEQSQMNPQPDSDLSQYKAAGKLTGKKAIVTGGDSGIGRAVAIAYAKEGADVAIVYLDEDNDAHETASRVEKEGRKCVVIRADVRSAQECRRAVADAVETLGGLNILVNNAAFQMSNEDFESLSEGQIRRTFETNILGYIWMAQAALAHLQEGDCIINTGSITGIQGNPSLIDYAATKGAIHNFTKSLAGQLGKKKIRVNCVAPGPVWTPLIPATMPEKKVKEFGKDVALERPGQPEELAPAYVYLASPGDSSYVSGAILEVIGGGRAG